jgi:hypothetical protein
MLLEERQIVQGRLERVDPTFRSDAPASEKRDVAMVGTDVPEAVTRMDERFDDFHPMGLDRASSVAPRGEAPP